MEFITEYSTEVEQEKEEIELDSISLTSFLQEQKCAEPVHETVEHMTAEQVAETRRILDKERCWQVVLPSEQARYYGFGSTLTVAIMNCHSNYHLCHWETRSDSCFICQLDNDKKIDLDTAKDMEVRYINFLKTAK
jgi:hypothetical protein